MPQQTECLADDGRIRVLKVQRHRCRDLTVAVFAPDGHLVGRTSLPKKVDQAAVEGLDPRLAYLVRVRRAHRLSRLRHPERTFEVRPRTRDLRVLVTGSGRCGTNSVAAYLDGRRFADGTPVFARHEPLAHWMLDAFIAGDDEFPVQEQRGALHNVEAAPYYSIYPHVIRAEQVVMLVRDGRRVVQSGINRGWYVRESRWDRIKPDYGLGQFESSCKLWVECNRNAAARADHVFRLEDLSLGGDHLARFDQALGLAPFDGALPHFNRGATTSDRADSWTEDQAKAFNDICGDVMDEYYPGWRSD